MECDLVSSFVDWRNRAPPNFGCISFECGGFPIQADKRGTRISSTTSATLSSPTEATRHASTSSIRGPTEALSLVIRAGLASPRAAASPNTSSSTSWAGRITDLHTCSESSGCWWRCATKGSKARPRGLAERVHELGQQCDQVGAQGARARRDEGMSEAGGGGRSVRPAPARPRSANGGTGLLCRCRPWSRSCRRTSAVKPVRASSCRVAR